ncbi:MAG TPA: protein kinase [Verrucomicrobiae bacterium]|jgi:serine/threonine protein kinase|nr:protein kinase [Verrucomicrobiae bacterium]
MSDPNQVEDALFAAAWHLSTRQRTSFLTNVCRADPELRLRLEERLAKLAPSTESTSDLETESEFDADATITSEGVLPREELIGQTIGRYKLIEMLGEGGFGTVYVAEQEEPVKRRVALKITKLGMDTKRVVGRFKIERQALAMMDHPGIAKVLDAGATESGRPYFVMELVKGVKITDYCDENNLSTHNRLKLFIQVCRAIEHAHQKGIIHRDIKPSNILITLHDGHPAPKVIDFGIAKATQESFTGHTAFTQFEQFVGTPAYMSPEQAELGGLDIDTRTDIYSLGVLLYELLTSQTPLESKSLLERGFDEMRRMIREHEPPRPSARLLTLKNSDSTTTAKRHGTDPVKLIKMVQGDLDWVVMKCLEKDRSRRYETAGNLAADVQRFLHDEPVEARPPSQVYRFQKWVRRNKLAFAAGSAVCLALFIGLGMTTWFDIKANQERKVAELATKRADIARQAAEDARTQAEADRKQSEIERQKAEVSRQRAEAALQQSEIDRAKALAAEKKAEDSEKEAQAERQQAESDRAKAQVAEKKAEDSEKEAQAARQQAETALQQARTEHAKADTAEKQSKDSQSTALAALREAEEAKNKAVAATSKSEESAKTAAEEANLRRQAEASASAALAETGQWRGAMTNLLASLDTLPPTQALKVADTFFPPDDLKQPWAAPFLRARGDWHARHGDSAAAIADFTQALNMRPDDAALHLKLAPLLADTGDTEGYGRHCAQFLKEWRETNNPAAAIDCLLTPSAAVNAPSLATLARNALAADAPGPQQAGWTLLLSLAEYRQNLFAEAAARAAKALSDTNGLDDARAAQAEAVLAMAQQQLNHPDDARTALATGRQILDTKMPPPESTDLGSHWPDWIAARLLLHEAQALVPATAASAAPK